MNYLLRVVMDAVFGDGSFHNEVIRKRTSSHNRAKRWGPVHDTILFYSRGKRFQWNRVLACQVIERRMRQSFELEWSEIEFLGMPKTPDHARTLAGINPFHFERWAASLAPWVEANKRQRGDGGIDGRGRIPLRKGEFADVVSQVKGGGTNPGHVQAFNGARQPSRSSLKPSRSRYAPPTSNGTGSTGDWSVALVSNSRRRTSKPLIPCTYPTLFGVFQA